MYDDVKEAILREMKLSAAAYLQRFNTCVKTDDETYVPYASKLRGLLVYYLNSKRVTTFENLKKLILCDRVKSTLSDNCLKHILSVESSRDRGWLPIKELTESVDRFIAAKGDSFKRKAFALDQTPTKMFKHGPTGTLGSKQKEANASIPKSVGSMSGPGPFKGDATPHKQIICYNCKKVRHISRDCPFPKKSGGTPKASAKRVAVLKPSSVEQGGEKEGDESHPGSISAYKQTCKVDHSTNTEQDPEGQTPTEPVCVETVVKSGDSLREEPVNKVSVCCPSTQLSSLTYVDVVVKPHENEPGFALKTLSDTGAQISILDA